MKTQALFALATLAAASSICVADDWQFKITVDNTYSAYFGNSTAATSFVGQDGTWQTTETYNMSGRSPGEWIYMTTASDRSTAQGFLGEFTNTTLGTTILTGSPLWEVFNAGAYLRDLGFGNTWPASTLPTQAQLNTAIAYASANNLWKAPTSGPANGASPWGSRPGISANARWIWYSANGDPDPTTPGFNHDEFLVFRLPGIVPAPGSLAILGVAVLGVSRRRR